MKKNIFLSILSGLLLALPFSFGGLWVVAWLAFLPLFFALRNQSKTQSFLLVYLCGVVFWSLAVYWLAHVTILGTIILILYLALYFGLFGLGYFYLTHYTLGLRQIFSVSCLWVLLEYARGYLFTGFPWALLGYSQYLNLPLIQIADLFGVWGVSFVVMMVNAAIYAGIREKKKLIVPILIIAVVLIYGYYRIYCPLSPESCPLNPASCSLIKVSVVQGNIPQNLKWDRRAISFIQNRYKELTLAASTEKPELIIWPEAAVPGLWGQDDAEFAQVFSLASQLQANLLVGAVAYAHQNYFNSALLIDRQGNPAAVYNKLHLVPFGEYVPLKNIFPFLETITPIGEIQPGREYTIFRQPANFGVLICFEDLFPELSREFVKRGAKFLVNITNDAWYKEGSAPYQHFAASVFRSVENRVYLARAANTGISGFISPAGRILGAVADARGKEIFVQGYLSQNICLAGGKRTIYNRYGDFFILFCLLFELGVIIITWNR